MPELHDIEIEGQHGLIAYFDANGEMTDDTDAAVTAIVTLDDGTVMHLAKPRDEEEEPEEEETQ